MKLSINVHPIDGIIWGFILHSLGGYLFIYSKLIGYTLCGLSILMIFHNSIFRIHRHKKPLNNVIRIIFYLYLFWIFIILSRPFFTSSLIPLRSGFSPVSPYLGLSYLMPFFLFIGIRNFPLRTIFKYSFYHGVIGLLLVVFDYRTIFSIPPILDFDKYQEHLTIIGFPVAFLSTCSFLLLFFFIIKNKYKIIALLSILFALFITLISGRRGSVFMSVLIILFAIRIYILYTKNGSRFTKFLLISIVFGIGLLVFMMYADTTFSFFFERLEEGTSSKTGIESYFWESFKNKPMDLFLGRGINGTYPSPYPEMPYRNIIETGYLQLILVGGIINLIFFICFLGYSVYLGYFKSNNLVLKAMALYLLYHILYLYPFGIPSFSFEYFIVWVFVNYCQNKYWRDKSNSEIRLHLYTN